MERLENAFLAVSVYLVIIAVIAFFAMLYGWAKKQKGAAMAFGMLVQMFLPDPKVQQTIEIVVEAKQKESKKSSVENTQEKE